MRLFKKKTKSKPRYIKYLSNVIQRDSMGYPLRLCMLSDNTHIWIDTYDEYVDDSDVELVWKECDIPFGDVVFPIRQGVMDYEYKKGRFL